MSVEVVTGTIFPKELETVVETEQQLETYGTNAIVFLATLGSQVPSLVLDSLNLYGFPNRREPDNSVTCVKVTLFTLLEGIW